EGSYTGAIADRNGILGDLNDDVLFLDEIGDLDRGSQRMLIRAIEEKKYSQFGSEKVQESDFRLVSATNRPLRELEGGDLDRDFFDRISVLRITMPALRDIPEDLDWIWAKMLTDVAARAGVDRVDLMNAEEKRIVDRLRNEELPGNYRDMMRVASHLLLFLPSADARFGSRKKAIDAALDEGLSFVAESVQDIPRELAVRYASGDSLKSFLSGDGINVKEALASYRIYLGTEIGNHVKKKEIREKSGIGYETMNKWRKGEA
ncbi:unnamed protein product, partial [marine sediment metagenome]